MREKHLTSKEREIQVINWFAIRIQHDNTDSATMYEVAGGLGMSPSSHLTKLLNGLCDKGSLTFEEIQKAGRWAGRGYRLAEGTFQRPPQQKREITVNSRKGTIQMEMF